ncbi:hypothetical protein [Jeotgalibacillus malaysiensis]|uniref:hypothetical protein n=1 Tax=Jeotgalibacillus malaysiensis TaxID=1508404 RepID=UPI00384C7143
MQFHTERLTVRLFKDEDLDDVFSIYGSDEACRYLLHEPWTHHNKLSDKQEPLW